MSRPDGPGPRERQPAVVIRDKRRIDPVTFQLREPDRAKQEDEDRRRGGGGPVVGPALGTVDRSVPSTADHAALLAAQLAERTADLQRLKAEYDNYRKRVRRDRLAIREIAVVNVLRALLPVLDAIDRARELGELTGGLRAVAEALEAQLAGLGLESVGAPGEPFDPTRHEALTQHESAGVDGPTCTAVLRSGYRIGEHLLRPAQVAVGEPPGRAGDG